MVIAKRKRLALITAAVFVVLIVSGVVGPHAAGKATLPERRSRQEWASGMNAERVWRTGGGSNGSVLSDLPFQLVWESTRLQPGRGVDGNERGEHAGSEAVPQRRQVLRQHETE